MALPFVTTDAGITWAQTQLTAGTAPDFGYVRLFSNAITASGATTLADLTPYSPDIRLSPVNILSRQGGVFVLEVVFPTGTDAQPIPTAGLFSQSGQLLAVASNAALIQRHGRPIRIRWAFTVTAQDLTSATFTTSGVAPASTTESGIVERATDAEATAGSDTVRYTTPAHLKAAIDRLLGGAPSALDTLNELAAALGDDENYAATITTALGTKLNSADYPAKTNQFTRFTTSGTWTKPAGARLVRVQVIGGGAGGTGTTSGIGYGGEGGYAVEAWFDAAILANSVPVVVGHGGTGGSRTAGAGRTRGRSGGNSSFGTAQNPYFVRALGGRGRDWISSSDTSPNIPSDAHTSSALNRGGSGGQATRSSSTAGEYNSYGEGGARNGGKGVDSLWGLGTGGGGYGSTQSGATPLAGGGGIPAGGGGGGGGNAGSSRQGGAGGRGEVRVWVY